MLSLRTLLFIIFSFFTASFVQAADEGLYEPAPPADSAFVRIIHANAANKTLSPTLGGKPYGKLTYPAISAYRVIPAGEHELVAGKLTERLTVEAGRYYTITLQMDNTSQLIADASIGNPAKARIYFYNLSDAAEATLFAPKQKAAILSKQAASSGTSRELNALTLPLHVLVNEKLAAQLPEVQLKRRTGTTVALFGKKSSYTALAKENSVAR